MKHLASLIFVFFISAFHLSAQDVVITVRVSSNPDPNNIENSITLECSRGGQSCGVASVYESIIDINPNESVQWVGVSDEGDVEVEIKAIRLSGPSNVLRSGSFGSENGSSRSVNAQAVQARPSSTLEDKYSFFIMIKDYNVRQWVDPKLRMRGSTN